MKPRISLAETTTPDGAPLVLEEHDGRLSLVSHGQQVCGPATKTTEEELARLACAPFRPARQPRILFVGLGLGHAVAAALLELRQKRASFIVAESVRALVEWHRNHIDPSPLKDEIRLSMRSHCSPEELRSHESGLHAIIAFVETVPLSPELQPWTDSPQWMSAAFDCLLPGGMLAIGSLRNSSRRTRLLRRAGFDVVESSVSSSPHARKARSHPVWLARKPGRGH